MPNTIAIGWFAGVALGAFVFPTGMAHSAPAGERLVSADVRQVQGPLPGAPKMCVGAGRAAEGLRADWQRQLTVVQKECGFTYLRMHGLLGDDMGVYREDKNTQTVYRVGYRVNDAYAVYLDLGSPAQLTRAQVERLHAASSGKPVERGTVTIRSDGTFERELPLRENDVFQLVLDKPERRPARGPSSEK